MKKGCGSLLHRGAFLCLLLTAPVLLAEGPPRIPAPLYTNSSIGNNANPSAPALAPNTIATLYGRDLSFETRAIENDQIIGDMLPTALIGAGSRVTVNGLPAALYYVSPVQINFLVPNIGTGPAEIRVVRDSVYGPAARLEIADVSPALYNLDPEYVIAARPDGSIYTFESPARRGNVLVLYATGLGRTRPRFLSGEIPRTAAPLERQTDFQVLIDGQAVKILYAGVAPGFAGLYQINVELGEGIRSNPEIRIGFEGRLSPAGVRLHAAGL